MMMIFIQGMCSRMILHSCSPSIKGILMSVISTSGWVASICDRAISPSEASPHSSKPADMPIDIIANALAGGNLILDKKDFVSHAPTP